MPDGFAFAGTGPATTPRLDEHRIVRSTGDDATSLFELAVLPAWELSRSRAWSRLTDTTQRLLGTVLG